MTNDDLSDVSQPKQRRTKAKAKTRPAKELRNEFFSLFSESQQQEVAARLTALAARHHLCVAQNLSYSMAGYWRMHSDLTHDLHHYFGGNADKTIGLLQAVLKHWCDPDKQPMADIHAHLAKETIDYCRNAVAWDKEHAVQRQPLSQASVIRHREEYRLPVPIVKKLKQHMKTLLEDGNNSNYKACISFVNELIHDRAPVIGAIYKANNQPKYGTVEINKADLIELLVALQEGYCGNHAGLEAAWKQTEAVLDAPPSQDKGRGAARG
jgi:hypothetical protein